MDKYQLFKEKSDQIELVLRRAGRWSDVPLSPERYKNMGAFGCNTMSFEQWIQFILLERIRVIIKEKDEFPSNSSVAAYAVRERDGDPDSYELIERLQELDDLINLPEGRDEQDDAPATMFISDRAPLGSVNELPLPPVVYQLAEVLHQFEGDGLESQLQTYDVFLNGADAKGREAISHLLSEAASRTTSSVARLRILKAAKSVADGGAAAAPYNHDEAMRNYREDFKKGYE